MAEQRTCLNCGWEVGHSYCPNCGQHIASHNKGVWQFVLEFLEEFVRFDSKLVRTIVPLVTKPGFLTTEWAAGKRVRYISPLKLYITISALFFLVLSVSPNSTIFNTHSELGHPASHHNHESTLDQFLNKGIPAMSHLDPSLLRQHVMSHLPTASLLLVPVSALLFSLLYCRSKRYYVEHLVFCLHYNCFCFLSYGVSSLFPGAIPRAIAFIWGLGYLLFAVKANYAQGWIKSTLKFVTFGGLYAVLVVSAIFATIRVSALLVEQSPMVR
jgi:hypothetical protein